jgi:biopolymer transport protein ExbD
MGAKFTGDDDVIADINITPFVDIILVVLIIFMVTATAIVKSSIKVNLPDAATADPTEETSLGLTLLPDGGLLLDGEPVTVDALKVAIRSAKAEKNDVVCLIGADKTVAHGRVIWLMDLVKSEGVARFAFPVNKTDAVPPDPGALGTEITTIPVSAGQP